MNKLTGQDVLAAAQAAQAIYIAELQSARSQALKRLRKPNVTMAEIKACEAVLLESRNYDPSKQL